MGYAEVVKFDTVADLLIEIRAHPDCVRRGVIRWQARQERQDPDNPYYETYLTITAVQDWPEGGCTLLESTEHCGDRDAGDTICVEIMEIVDHAALECHLKTRPGKIEIP